MGKTNHAAVTGFLLCFAAIVFGIVTNGGFKAILNLIHIPSFIVTFGGAFFAAMMTMLCVMPLAGVFAYIVGAIATMRILDTPEPLGTNLAVAMLSLFYSVIFEIFLIPTAVRLRKQMD